MQACTFGVQNQWMTILPAASLADGGPYSQASFGHAAAPASGSASPTAGTVATVPRTVSAEAVDATSSAAQHAIERSMGWL